MGLLNINPILLTLLLTGCGSTEKPKDPGPFIPELLSDAQENQLQMIVELGETQDLESGWPDALDCDGMVWAGHHACGSGEPDLRASAYPEVGRFGRAAARRCWTKEDGDVGSKTTWSNDMGKLLIAGAWCQKDRKILEDHERYGRANAWVMGEGEKAEVLARAVYRPHTIGLLYQAIFALGGPDNANRLWPNLYPQGLEGYEARLQMEDIWLRGEIALALDAPQDAPHLTESKSLLNVSRIMYRRIEEHHNRQPENPFYAALYGVYSGDITPALEICSNPKLIKAEGVRCKTQRACELAFKIHSCKIILDHIEKHRLLEVPS